MPVMGDSTRLFQNGRKGRKIGWFFIIVVFGSMLSTNALGVHEKVPCADCLDQLAGQVPRIQQMHPDMSENDLCLACHDAARDTSGQNPPYVVNGPADLAGGSFTGSLRADGNGHNIQVEDASLGLTPPGGAPRTEMGCLSCHDPNNNGNFRNLKTEVNGIPTPVQALADPNYQHNVYIAGMSRFCGACHEKFYGDYNTRGANGWLRHPVGISVSSAKNADYTWWSQVANRITQAELPSGDPNNTAGARVFCLTCHRAHASSYSDAMRWDYAGGAGGCLECHKF
jgi:hypothetical protein